MQWVPHSLSLLPPPPSSLTPSPLCADNAYLSAQSTGLTPALCTPTSLFTLALTSCNDCINANSPSPSAVIASFINPRFAPYINYCALSLSTTTSVIALPDNPNPTALPTTGTVPLAYPPGSLPSILLSTIATLPAAESASIEAKWSSVAGIASSGGYFVVPTELLIVTTETLDIERTMEDGRVTTSREVRATTIPNLKAWNYTVPGTGQGNGGGQGMGGGGSTSAGFRMDGGAGGGGVGGGSNAWIAGPVIGCVLGIAMIVLGGLFFMRRRRRRQEDEARNAAPEGGDALGGKAQLHGECVPRPMTPREMDAGKNTFWQLDEMSANEIPAAELQGDDSFWVRDEKIRPESGSTF